MDAREEASRANRLVTSPALGRTNSRFEENPGPMRRAIVLAAALCAVLVLPGPAAHASEDEDAALCERAIVNGARRAGVPVPVLHAIALTETGRKAGGRVRPYPWAINREGKGHWFKSRAEALAFAEDSLRQGRKSFDVGCVQINYRWHGHAFPSLDAMFDPEWTATYAAQFLRTLYEERGNWSAAAGAYHSLTPELAQIYRARFDRLLAGLAEDALTGDETLLAAAATEAPRSTRTARRQADRLAAAERIRDAGPPPEPVMGSLAALAIAPAGPALLAPGAPLLTEGRPLIAGPGRSLF